MLLGLERLCYLAKFSLLLMVRWQTCDLKHVFFIISSPDIMEFESQNLVYVKWMVPNKIVRATKTPVEFY